jgi:hypothetical protein
MGKKNVSSEGEIEFWSYFFVALWIFFSDFLGKWWFFLCESVLKNKIFA